MSPNALRLASQNPAAGPSRAPHARRCVVRVETDYGVYVGKVYVAHGRGRVSDVLSDERPFLNLTEVRLADSNESEAFVAINKRYIRTLRVLDEAVSAPAGAPASA